MSGTSTRQRLLDAAVDVMRTEGLAAVRTGRLTREVGLVQSAFYGHFGSIDDVVVAAAERVAREVRDPAVDLMTELRTTDGSAAEVAARYRQLLGTARERWPAVDLLLRHRRDRSGPGAVLAGVDADVRADVHRHLLALDDASGPDTRRTERLRRCAGQVVAIVYESFERLADEPPPDEATLAWEMAVATEAVVAAAFEDLAGGGASEEG